MSRHINQNKANISCSCVPLRAQAIAVSVAGVSSINPARGSTEGQSKCSSPEPMAPVVGIQPAYPVRKHPGNSLQTAGVSPISTYIHQAHHLNRPAMLLHPGRARRTRICVNLRHYRFLQSVPAPVFSACDPARTSGRPAGVVTPKKLSPLEDGPQSRLIFFRVGAAGPISLRPVFSDIGTAQAPKSGNPSTGGVNTIPAVPIFDFSTTLYAAVLRPVPFADRPGEKDGLYGSAGTFAPRSGFICFKTTAAQLMADAVSAANSSFSKLRHYLVRFSGIASVFSYMAPTNQRRCSFKWVLTNYGAGTAATNPLKFCNGWHGITAVPPFCKPFRSHFSTHRPNQPYEPPRRMG